MPQIVAGFLFILLRSTSIIIPPIPGIAFDFIGIKLFGFLWGFILAETGTMLGASVAFFIARKLKRRVNKIVSLRKIHEWEEKISDNKKFWALTLLRLPTNALFDYISYGAGLTNISFLKFFFSSLIGNIPVMVCFYFFGDFFFQKGIYYALAFILVVIILWLFLGGKKLLFHLKSN